MTDDDLARLPGVRASDADREAVVSRLQTALAEGRIDVDEFGQRAGAAHAAVTTAELAALVADLPDAADPHGATPPVEVVGAHGPEQLSSFFGDVVLAGAVALPRAVSTVFGDIRLDLRSLPAGADRVELRLGTVFGDVDVVVAEGVAAELEGWTVFGDKRTQLAPVPRVPGTPRVVVRARTIFGDLRLRSLAPGEPTSRWRARFHRGH